jgi:hypothetical protein
MSQFKNLYLASCIVLFAAKCNGVLADELELKFSLDCEQTNGVDAQNIYGQELDNFRQVVSAHLSEFECSQEVGRSEHICAANRKWPIDSETWLIQTYCEHGAYLTSSAWFTQSSDGIYPLEVMYPTFEWKFGGAENRSIESVVSTGFAKTSVLTNATYEPDKRLLKHNVYCCAGDLMTSISWHLIDGVIRLHRYSEDAIADGKTSDQITINYYAY